MPDGERRRENDQHLLVRWASEFAYQWQHVWGPVAKGITLLLGLVGAASTTASMIFTFGVFYADFDGLPAQVAGNEEAIARNEVALQAHIDTTTRPGLRRIAELEGRTSALENGRAELRTSMSAIRTMVRGLQQLAEANHCWILVENGLRTRFECSAHPEEDSP